MRFVVPEVKRYTLKNGTDWIDLKKELTVGEERKYRTRGMRAMTGVVGAKEDAPPAIDIDWQIMSLSTVEAYLVDWSDKRPVCRESIEALAQEDFDEIDAIVKKHVEAVDAAKKPKATPSEASATLPSA